MSDQPDPVKPDPSKKPKRPADANQRAKMIVDLATGEVEEAAEEKQGTAGGLVGGKARAAKLSAVERSEIAKKAAAARWNKD